VAVGLAGGFAFMLSKFLEQTLVVRRRRRGGRPARRGGLGDARRLYGIVTSRDLIHLVICLSVVQSSTYVLLISIGYKREASRPCSPTGRRRRGRSTRSSRH
jgi:hypothetical protein